VMPESEVLLTLSSSSEQQPEAYYLPPAGV